MGIYNLKGLMCRKTKPNQTRYLLPLPLTGPPSIRGGWNIRISDSFETEYSSKYSCVILVKLFLYTLSQRPCGASI